MKLLVISQCLKRDTHITAANSQGSQKIMIFSISFQKVNVFFYWLIKKKTFPMCSQYIR